MNQRYIVEADFIHNGLRCVVVMTNMGHRCGYVGVTKDHPLFSNSYTSLDFDVHGGLTYSGGGENSKYPVESDLWWFGYDCAHFGDGKDLNYVSEELKKHMFMFVDESETIRTLDYCIEECKSLANQLFDYKGDKQQ